MKQLMLAAVASIALSLPVMAQSNDTHTMQPSSQNQNTEQGQTAAPGSGGQLQNRGSNQSQIQNGGNQQAQNRIDPSQLSTQQIRQIQMTLNKKGFDADRVDGKWGPETQAALKNFQEKQNIEGAGHLDQQTLAALGVSENGQGPQGSARQDSATTGSGSDESRMNAPSQNPGAMKDGTNRQSSPSMNSGTGSTNSGMDTGTPSGNSKPATNDSH